MFGPSKSQFVALDVSAGDPSKTKHSSLWRRWKRMTSFQKKVVLAVLLILLITGFLYMNKSTKSTKPLEVSKKSGREIKLNKKEKLVFEKDEEVVAQVENPGLAQLDDAKKKALQALENRIQNDMLKDPERRRPPKIIAGLKKDKQVDFDLDSDNDMQMVPVEDHKDFEDPEEENNEEGNEPEQKEEQHEHIPAPGKDKKVVNSSVAPVSVAASD